jgi:hypothetical protein
MALITSLVPMAVTGNAAQELNGKHGDAWLICGAVSSAAPCSRRAASMPGSAVSPAGLRGTASIWAI